MAEAAGSSFPPGHFHSPIPSATDIERAVRDPVDESLAGIELRIDAQLALVDQLSQFVGDLPFEAEPVPGLRYHYENPYFSYGDGIVYACMLRHLRPSRIIEAGSGFSSALALDVSDRFLDRTTQFTFIDPNPQRLRALPTESDSRRKRLP
jgi:hypothetical protein